jgi:hypothetical protein
MEVRCLRNYQCRVTRHLNTQPALVRAFLHLSFLTTPNKLKDHPQRPSLESERQQQLIMLRGK